MTARVLAVDLRPEPRGPVDLRPAVPARHRPAASLGRRPPLLLGRHGRLPRRCLARGGSGAPTVYGVAELLEDDARARHLRAPDRRRPAWTTRSTCTPSGGGSSTRGRRTGLPPSTTPLARDWTWFWDADVLLLGRRRLRGRGSGIDDRQAAAAAAFERGREARERASGQLAKPKGFRHRRDRRTARRRGDARRDRAALRGHAPVQNRLERRSAWTRLRVAGGPRPDRGDRRPRRRRSCSTPIAPNNGLRTTGDPRAAAPLDRRAVCLVQNLLDFLTVAW